MGKTACQNNDVDFVMISLFGVVITLLIGNMAFVAYGIHKVKGSRSVRCTELFEFIE